MSQPISVQDTAEAEKSCASCRFRVVFPRLFMHEAGPFSVFWGSFSVFVLIEAACFSMFPNGQPTQPSQALISSKSDGSLLLRKQ